MKKNKSFLSKINFKISKNIISAYIYIGLVNRG